MTVAASFVMPPRDAFGNIAATPNPFTAAVQTEVGAKYTVAAPSGSGTVKVIAPSGTVIGSGTSVSFTATTASVVLVVDSPAAGYITMSLIPPPSDELPTPSASGDVLTATGTDAGDYDWATPVGTVPTPPASGDVLTSTGSAAGDYDWATPQTGSTIPDPPASGDVLTSTGTAAGDWDWAAVLPTPSASGDVLTATGTGAGDYDWAAPASGGGLLAHTSYDPSTQAVYTPSSTALTAIDTTNLAVTFTAPSSGAVLVVLEAVATSEVDIMYLGVTDSAGQVGHHGALSYDSSSTNSLQMRQTFSTLVAGLTPGDSYTYYFAAETNSGNIYAGGGTIADGGRGPASISVWEAP